MTTTDRQFIALFLYYCRGESYRKIGTAFGIDGKTAYDLVQRGKRRLITYHVEQAPHTLPLVGRLTQPSPTSSLTRNVGQVASRREELLDALERRMAQRDAELADIEECMAGDSFSPTRTKQNPYDQWEMRYLSKHPGEPMPTSAYIHKRRGGGPAEYCAAPTPCSFTPRCVGCPHD